MALVDSLTESITSPFMCPELVGRLADLLLFVVRSLAGKAAAKAKVDNMEKCVSLEAGAVRATEYPCLCCGG